MSTPSEPSSFSFCGCVLPLMALIGAVPAVVVAAFISLATSMPFLPTFIFLYIVCWVLYGIGALLRRLFS